MVEVIHYYTLSFVLSLPCSVCKVELICEPCVNNHGGIPAGCQSDKDGNLYVADMRLGILFVKGNGEFQQVSTYMLKSTYFLIYQKMHVKLYRFYSSFSQKIYSVFKYVI